MLAILRLTTVALVVSITLASQCCFPRQYEAVQGIMKTTFENSKISSLAGNIKYSFDAVSRQEAFFESLIVDGNEMQITVIKDYNVTNKKYVITGDSCTIKSLDPFKEGCISDGSSKLTDGYIGEPGTGSSFSVYNNSASTVTSFIIATQPQDNACFPIMDVSGTTEGSAPYMQTVFLYNFTLGIQDRSVFDIPRICLS